MRSLRVLLAGLVGAIALVILSPAPSFACSCAVTGVEEYVDLADVVMVATFERRDNPVLGLSSADPAAYTLNVHRVLKGEARASQEVLTPVSGASCGLENVELGQRYVVFAAYRDLMGEPSDDLWSLLCSGNAKATPAFLAEVEAITGPGTPVDGGSAFESDLTLTFDDPEAASVGGALAVPFALVGGGALSLLTGALWLRFHRS